MLTLYIVKNPHTTLAPPKFNHSCPLVRQRIGPRTLTDTKIWEYSSLLYKMHRTMHTVSHSQVQIPKEESKYFLFKIFIKFIGVTLIKLYRFQPYNSVIRHLYITLCVHHWKSSLPPSPFISFTLFRLPPPLFLWWSPYCALWLVFFFFFFFCLISSSFYPAPQPLTPLTLSIFSLYLWVFFYFVCLFCSLDFNVPQLLDYCVIIFFVSTYLLISSWVLLLTH